MHYEDEKHQTQSPFNWSFLLILHLGVVTSSWNEALRHGAQQEHDMAFLALLKRDPFLLQTLDFL